MTLHQTLSQVPAVRPAKANADVKSINLALQGGGAHGAFAWGVLDRLLEDDRLAVEAISATSAGAMNAVVLAHGISHGGQAGARAKLAEFWQAISRAGELYSPVRTSPWEKWLTVWGVQSETSPSYTLFEALTRMFSPYQLNPWGFNPLRDVLTQVVDFAHLAKCPKAPRLFLSATNVRTGKIKVFDNRMLTADVVLASACLPFIFQAVEIDGEHYWDGGFMGNPAIFPLIRKGASKDVVIVHINPLERTALPRTTTEIFNRINEISFNSSLMREMRAVAFVTRLIDDQLLDDKTYNRMLIHSIGDDVGMANLSVATKLNPDWAFLCRLRDAGRRRTEEWLDKHRSDLGQMSTVDLQEVYL